MPGIIPNTSAGAIEVRDASGTCLAPAGVSNAYCPPAAFVTTCPINFLPDGCAASITAAQINAFQSELLCLAEKFNPTGTWNCGSLCNLSSMFNSWLTGSYSGSLRHRISQVLCSSTVITEVQLAADGAAAFLMCNGAGTLVKYAGRPLTSATQIVDAVCSSPGALEALQECIKAYPSVAVASDVGLSVSQIFGVDGNDIYIISATPATAEAFGMVKLATAGDYPQHSNDEDAATPAYVKEAIDAVNSRPCDLPAATPAQLAAIGAASKLTICVEEPAGTFSNVSITFQQLADALIPLMGVIPDITPLYSTFGVSTGVTIAPSATATETDEVFDAFASSIGFVAPPTLSNAFGVAIN